MNTHQTSKSNVTRIIFRHFFLAISLIASFCLSISLDIGKVVGLSSNQIDDQIVVFPLKITESGQDVWVIFSVNKNKQLQKIYTFETGVTIDPGPFPRAVLLSPDRTHVAIQYEKNSGSTRGLAIFEIAHPENFTIIEEVTAPGKQECGQITPPYLVNFVWQDDINLVFAQTLPSSCNEQESVPKTQSSGELWRANIQTGEKTRIATGEIFQVLGISPDSHKAYITRMHPILLLAINHYTGLGMIDLETNQAKYAFPSDDELDERPTQYFDLPVIFRKSDGKLIFRLTNPPISSTGMREMWDVDLNSLSVIQSHIQKYSTQELSDKNNLNRGDQLLEALNIDHGASSSYLFENTRLANENFDLGVTEWPISDASNNEAEIYYLTNQNELKLKDWTGRVIQTWSLLNESKPNTDKLSSEIVANPAYVSNAVVNWNVPYLHQLKDTEDTFDGHGACGPTSSVMALAYFNRIKPNPMWINSYQRNTDYGRYISQAYSVTSACEIPSTFDTKVKDFRNDPSKTFAGAHGQMYDPQYGTNNPDRIRDFFKKHDLGAYVENDASRIKFDNVKAELDGGGIVILGFIYGNDPGYGWQGHILVVRGYTSDNKLIVNDPAGKVTCNPSGAGNADYSQNGTERLYSWSDLSCRWVSWYVAVYPPQYLTNLTQNAYQDGKIALQNSSNYGATADICFMNNDGSRNSKLPVSLAANGNQWVYAPLNFSGSAVVVPKQLGMGVVGIGRTKYAPYSNGAYSAVPAQKTSSTYYVPLLFKNSSTLSGQANSTLMIQNTSLSSVAVTVAFYNQLGTKMSYERQITLSPSQVDTYNMSNMLDGWYGSAQVSAAANGKINVTSEAVIGGYSRMSYSAFAAEDISTNWVIPQFASRVPTINNTPFSTPIVVQNLSGSTIPVNGVMLSCNATGNVGPSTLTVWNTSAIAPNAAYYAFNPAPDTSGYPTGWVGSCKVSSSYSMAVLAQLRLVSTGPVSNQAAYEAMRTNSTQKRLLFPRIEKVQSDGSGTAVIIRNLNESSSASVTLNYYGSPLCSSANYGPIYMTINPGQSLTRNHRLSGSTGDAEGTLPNGWCGSLVVTSNQPIAGFAQFTNINNFSGDTFMAHNGIPLP